MGKLDLSFCWLQKAESKSICLWSICWQVFHHSKNVSFVRLHHKMQTFHSGLIDSGLVVLMERQAVLISCFTTYSNYRLHLTMGASQSALRARLRQASTFDNSAVTIVILLSLKAMESLENRLQTHTEVAPLFSTRTVSLASSQSWRSFDSDTRCKRALKILGLKTF